MQLKATAAEHEIVEGEEIGADNWIVDEVTDETIVFKHISANQKVTIKQDKPEGAGLPFTVTRENHNGDEYQLTESDWFSESYTVAAAHMIGFSEGIHQAESE